MNGFVILGTDTDAGKTTFALLWMSQFADQFEYWKPLESGASDTHTIRELVPGVRVHPPVHSFRKAVAPPLAAREEQITIPHAAELARKLPSVQVSNSHLVIETFGSPLSPLNETQLQLEFIKQLNFPQLLVSSSSVGAIGRVLQTLKSIDDSFCCIFAVVLLGPKDDYAVQEISKRHPAIPVFSIALPNSWDQKGLEEAKDSQSELLSQLYLRYLSLKGMTWPGTASFDSPKNVPDSSELQESYKSRFAWTNRQTSSLTTSLLDFDKKCLWHPYTSLQESEPPIIVSNAHEEFLCLVEGGRLIDGISSWWTILHGHRHPVLMSALKSATVNFDHVHFAGITHLPAIRLGELLSQSAPWKDGRVFYSDNGSTAVEVALKMAYQYWCHRNESQRTLFVGFENGYHGDTFGAMAASRDPVFFGRFEPLLFQTEIIPVSANRLDETLAKHKGKVAAIIIEPLVQGAGGMQMHSPQELRDIFEVTRRHDVLFIADEVMTGGRRLGPIWAHSLADIAPDFICASKTIAGGVLPIAATLVAPHIVAEWQTDDRSKTFFHGHSFTAHPIACAVGATNWQMLLQQTDSGAKRIESHWQRLTTLAELPQIREVRIRGSIVAVELNIPGGYLADVGRQLRHEVLQHGVLLRPLGSVLYAMPPLETSDESLERIANAITVAVQKVKVE